MVQSEELKSVEALDSDDSDIFVESIYDRYFG